jgi:hypothetical protein
MRIFERPIFWLVFETWDKLQSCKYFEGLVYFREFFLKIIYIFCMVKYIWVSIILLFALRHFFLWTEDIYPNNLIGLSLEHVVWTLFLLNKNLKNCDLHTQIWGFWNFHKEVGHIYPVWEPTGILPPPPSKGLTNILVWTLWSLNLTQIQSHPDPKIKNHETLVWTRCIMHPSSSPHPVLPRPCPPQVLTYQVEVALKHYTKPRPTPTAIKWVVRYKNGPSILNALVRCSHLCEHYNWPTKNSKLLISVPIFLYLKRSTCSIL